MAPTPPTLNRHGDRAELRLEREFAHSPDLVWRAITEREHLSAWYPFPAAEIDLRVGGRIRFEVLEGVFLDADITEVDPPHAFAFAVPRAGDFVPGGWETAQTFRITLSAKDSGCLLTFVQTFTDYPAAASYAAGWQACLDALARDLDGKPAEPGMPDAELYESYVHLFGLDHGWVAATPDGHRVQFARQLMMRPVDAVWAALTADRPLDTGTPAPESLSANGIAAGPITAVTPGRVVEYARAERDETVRWELADGPGGARILLTHTGPATAADAEDARAAWAVRLADLVHGLDAANR